MRTKQQTRSLAKVLGHFHVPKREMTQCFELINKCCQKVLKHSRTAEFTSELKNTFTVLQTANVVLQTPNTATR